MSLHARCLPLLVELSAVLALAGCDSLVPSRAVDGNSYTEQPNHLQPILEDGINEWSLRFPGRPTAIIAADLDGDGRDEIVVHYANLRVAQVGRTNEETPYFFYWLDPVPTPERGSLSVADLDGDKIQDLAVIDLEQQRVTGYGVNLAAGKGWHVAQISSAELPSGSVSCCAESPAVVADVMLRRSH